MSERRADLNFDRSYDASTMARIAKGYYPLAQEQKWFIWFDGKTLFLHRASSGFCIFVLDFNPGPDGSGRTIATRVSREAEHYSANSDPESDLELLEMVIRDWLISKMEGPDYGPMPTGFSLAAQPNYLGNPNVMGELLQDVIKVAIAHYKREIDFNAAWDVVWTLGNQISAAEEYIALGSWHDMPDLGEALRRAFRRAPIPESVDDLNFRVSEGLMALFFAVPTFWSGSRPILPPPGKAMPCPASTRCTAGP